MVSNGLTLAVVAVLLAVGFQVHFHWDALFSPAQEWRGLTHWLNKDAWRYSPLDWLPFTPLLTCEPNVSALMSRFDWKIVPLSGWKDLSDPDNASSRTGDGLFDTCGSLDEQPWAENTTVADPKTVWATPHAVQRLLDIAEKRLDTKRPNRVVVFSGSEMPLSRAFGRNDSERRETVKQLQKYFKRIVYQTKDIRLPGVDIAPMGLCWGYMMTTVKVWVDDDLENKNVSLEESYSNFTKTIRGNLSTKSRDILATGGLVAGWLSANATMEGLKLLAFYGMLYPPSNSSLKAVATAYESRLRLRAWLGLAENGTEVTSPAGRAAGVEYRFFSQREWWHQLAKYKFLLSPLGSGIQAAKNIEALLVLTIPVIQRMSFTTFDDLVRIGFPLVLVNGWVEVTPANASRWWKAISPRLESFRENCLTVEGYWQLYTGQMTFCT